MIHIFILAGTANAVPATSTNRVLKERDMTMAFAQDLTGMKFGELVVVRRASNDEVKKNGLHGESAHWLCKCSCGGMTIKSASKLKIGIKSARCPNCSYHRFDAIHDQMIGKSFGALTVIGWEYKESSGRSKHVATFECECICGSHIWRRKQDIIEDIYPSCGCQYGREQLRKFATFSKNDLTGRVFGNLTVVRESNERSRDGSIKWVCRCKCGSEVLVSSTYLSQGRTISCGCTNSRGELKISQMLDDHNITFIKNYRFPDLKSENNRVMPFDFGIVSKDGLLRYIIEFDGIQHYKPSNTRWGGKFNYDTNIKHDNLKDQYCFDRRIPIIRIPYTHFNDLCIGDLLLQTSRFRHSKKGVMRRVCQDSFIEDR